MSNYISLNRLEFVVTYLCNSRCEHCYTIPKRTLFPNHIDKGLAIEILRKVGERYDLESVMTFGGEPTLFPEIVCAVHREAREIGIPERELITNGYWSKNPRKIREMAKKFAESGINEIYISVDVFHQKHIPLEIVRITAEACVEQGIEIYWDPCWVVSEKDENPYNEITRSILKELEDLPVKMWTGNTLEPDRSTLLDLDTIQMPREKYPEGRCGDMLYTDPLDSIKSICVEPDGRIAVCTDFYIGNAGQRDIIELLEEYDPFKVPEMKAIIEGGMKGLLRWAEGKGVKPEEDGYYSVCHMCTDLRRRVKLKEEKENIESK